MGNHISTLKKRVIPIILFSNYQVVKSRQFSDYRVFGNLEQTISVFNQRNVDEIIILDVDASKKNSGINLEVLKILSKDNIMPLAFGGGISKIEDIEKCLKFGCDKVIINTKSLIDSEFVSKASSIFGKQCIVVSVDYKLIGNNKWKVFSHTGLETSHLEPKKHISNLIEMGAGEILITSVDHEGTMNGYDPHFKNFILKDFEVPILINGGCGKPDHMITPLKNGIDGVCGGSIFFYTQYGYKDIKNYLIKNKLNVRPS